MVRCPAHCPQARLSARQVKLAVAVAVPMVAAMCLSAAGLSVIGSVITATVTLEVVAAVVIVVAVRLRLRQPRQAAAPAPRRSPPGRRRSWAAWCPRRMRAPRFTMRWHQ